VGLLGLQYLVIMCLHLSLVDDVTTGLLLPNLSLLQFFATNNNFKIQVVVHYIYGTTIGYGRQSFRYIFSIM